MLPSIMSDACRQQLTEPSEGTGPRVAGGFKCYRDCVGVVTGGYGHTAAAGAPIPVLGEVWSQEKCDAVLKADLAKFCKGVAALLVGLPFEVKQREFDALSDLAFNIGLGAFRSSSLLAAYRRGDLTLTAAKFMDWTKGGGRVLPGLVARRKREAAWFLDGRIARTSVAFIDEALDLPMAHLIDHPDNAVIRWLNSRRAPQLEAA